MFKVVLFSTLRSVPTTFAKRYRLNFHMSRFDTAYRRFSSLSDAQDFAFNLLGHIERDYTLYISNDNHDVLTIYQEGW